MKQKHEYIKYMSNFAKIVFDIPVSQAALFFRGEGTVFVDEFRSFSERRCGTPGARRAGVARVVSAVRTNAYAINPDRAEMRRDTDDGRADRPRWRGGGAVKGKNVCV